MRRFLLLLCLVACGSSNGAESPSGGNVSFGGAQDIGEFRGILDSGGIPGPDTLDANGFFNEHYAPPPMTDCTGVLCLTPGVAVGKDWLTGAHQATLALAVSTTVDPSMYQRMPMNLVVVVDHSGSMAQDGRLDKVKAGLSTLIDGLQDTDRLAIVQFDDTVQIEAPLGQALDRAALHAIVDALQPGGGTNIFDGLQQGFELSTGALASDHQNRVIFLSDGMATVGNTDDSAIMTMADGFVEQGIGLTTIGVGAEFDVTLMRGLAEHGAGNFYFLEDPTAATEVFTQELDYFMTPLALGIDVHAVAGDGYDFGEVVGSSLWDASSRAGSMHMPAAFVASRTSQSTEGGRRGGGSMLFIHLDPTGNNPDGKVADLVMNYHLPDGTLQSQSITLAYPNDPTETPDPAYLSAPEIAPRYAMYNMYLGLRYATEATEPNCAVAALQSTRAAAAAWNVTHEDADIAADLMLIDEYVANLRTAGATATDATTLATCQNASDPYGDNGWGNGDERTYACSAGGSPGGLLVIGLAGLVAARRRR